MASGDPRGSVDRDHRTVGQPFAPRDDFRRKYQERQLKAPPLLLSVDARAVVHEAITEVCLVRGWELLALNVRTNHAHVVTVASAVSAEKGMGDFKAYSTRALRRSRLVAQGRPVWAGHGSTMHCWTEAEVETVVDYTLNRQGENLSNSEWLKRKPPD